MKLKKKEKKRKIFIELQKKEARANHKVSKTNFGEKPTMDNYFISSGYFHNGISCEMSDDVF